MLWIDFSKSNFVSSLAFSLFQVPRGCVVEHCRSLLLWMYGIYLGSSWLFRCHLCCPSVYLVLVIYCVAVSEQYVTEFLCLPYFYGHLIKPCSFLLTWSSSCVNCPSLMSSWLLIFFVITFRVFQVNSWNVVSKGLLVLLGWQLSI